MNATVSRIVELLFEDVQMTEETEAIHDEVMNNCQERYASLVAEGYSEDDAIGAVVESLKGMDEVLKDADVIHHCMNDLSKPVKEKEQTRFDKLCAEFGF